MVQSASEDRFGVCSQEIGFLWFGESDESVLNGTLLQSDGNDLRQIPGQNLLAPGVALIGLICSWSAVVSTELVQDGYNQANANILN